jgi:hypothetical protein
MPLFDAPRLWKAAFRSEHGKIKVTDAIKKTPGSLTCLGSAVSRCLNLGFWTARQGVSGIGGLPLCRPNVYTCVLLLLLGHK